jgi:hypothetical protein
LKFMLGMCRGFDLALCCQLHTHTFTAVGQNLCRKKLLK